VSKVHERYLRNINTTRENQCMYMHMRNIILVHFDEIKQIFNFMLNHKIAFCVTKRYGVTIFQIFSIHLYYDGL